MLIDSEDLKTRMQRELPISGLPMSSIIEVYVLKIIREMENESR